MELCAASAPGGGVRDQRAGATAPGGQKSHKLAWGGGCSNTVRKKLADSALGEGGGLT